MKNIFKIIILLLTSYFVRSQECIQVHSYAGFSNQTDIDLQTEACLIKSFFTDDYNVNVDLHVYESYPILAYVEDNQGLTYSTESIKNTIRTESQYFIALIKEYGADMTNPVGIKPYIKIPSGISSSNPFLSSRIENAITNYVEENDLLSDPYRVDKDLLTEMLNIFQSAANFTVEDLEKDGIIAIPIDADTDITSTIQSGGNIRSIIKLIEGGNEYDFEKIFPSSTDYGSIWSFTNNLFVTSDLNAGDELDEIQNDFLNVESGTINMWCHFVGADEASRSNSSDDRMMLIKCDMTKDDAESITNFLFDETMQEHGAVLHAFNFKGKEESVDRDPEWYQLGKQFMESEYFDSAFIPGIKGKQFQGGISCGLIDGIAGTIHAIYKLSKGVSVGLFNTLKYAFINGVQLLNPATTYFAATKVFRDANEWTKSKREAISKLWDNVQNLYNNKDLILVKLNNAMSDWYGDLLNLTKEAGYDIGVLLFDVIFTVFTWGAGSAVTGGKFLIKMKKILSGTGNFGKMFDDLVNGVSKAGAWAKQNLTLCKMLGKGCFVKDTPVLIAGNSNQFSLPNSAKAIAVAAVMPIVSVPIQEVQLLDYAVAHETVNSTYDLTASIDDNIYLGLIDKDPYTSNQQRKRDGYEINDIDWNEVVFEEMYGGSTAKMAIHRDWINQNGYQVDAVVEMNLPEQDISGPFKITSIKHIVPQEKPIDDEADGYNFKPVTALFSHETNQIFTIDFENNESIGVTYRHPLYSITEGDWKQAGELKVGEKVLSKSGNITVSNIKREVKNETVYNLEIKDFHNFLVTNSGVVVHNACVAESVECAMELVLEVVEESILELPGELANGKIGQSIMKIHTNYHSTSNKKTLAERFLKSFKDNVPLYLGAAAIDIYEWLEGKNKNILKESECILELMDRISQYPDLKDKLIVDLTEVELLEFCGDYIDADDQIFAKFADNLGMVKAWKVLYDIGDATSVALKTDVVFLERFNSLLQNPQYSNILDPLTSGAHNKLLGHGVNNTEEAAMKLFVADDYYRNYNKALAGEISMTPEYHAMKELMEAAHTKLPKVDDAVVFRGAGSEESAFASNLVNGQEFHFNGRFTSSSYEEYVADLFRKGNGGTVIWKIESKTGVDIKKINSGESEVLFKPFTNYKLLDVSPSSTDSQVAIYTIKEL